MITTKQKWILGGLVTLSASIWTPQVLQRVTGDARTQSSVEAGPAEDEMLSIEMGTTGGGLPSMARPATSTGGTTSGVQAARAPLPQGGAAGSSAIVSEVLQTLRRTEAFGAAARPGEPVVASTDDAVVTQEPEARPSIFTFLESNPLRGTIVGEKVSVALIGKHRVRLGETVPGTGAVLTEIGRGRAKLEDGALSVELELKPLETSAALMNARAQQRAAAQASAGNGDNSMPGEGTPTPSNSPIPANPNSPASTPETPGSQGDF